LSTAPISTNPLAIDLYSEERSMYPLFDKICRPISKMASKVLLRKLSQAAG